MKVQTVKCKKCNEAIAACIEPHCYTDKEWQKDLRQFALDGFGIEMKDNPVNWCKCEPMISEPTIFDAEERL